MKKIILNVLLIIMLGTASVWAQNEWKLQTSNTSQDLLGIHFPNRLLGWAVGENGTIINTTTGGNVWYAQNSGLGTPLNSVFFISESKGWVAGDQGKILHTSNYGSNWVEQTSGTTERLTAVHFTDSLTGWIVGTNGTILHTTDGGTTWSPQTSAAIPSSNDVFFINSSKGWAVGNTGKIITTTNGGSDWISRTSGTSFNLMGVNFPDENHGWAVGIGGTIIYSSDGGTTWNSATSGVSDALISIHFTDTLTGYAVGVNGLILKTADGGFSWKTQNSSLSNNLRHVYFFNNNPGWICGNGGKILNLKSSEEICMITVDTITYKYMLLWEQMSGQGTSYYNIYKLSGTNYVNIGTVPYSQLSMFVDVNSKPDNKPERYKISAVDSFDNETTLSPYHEIMFLQASQGTPATSVNLSWNKYTDESGAFVPEWYYVYRGSSPSGMYLLDSVSGSGAPMYTDNNVLSVYYYRVSYNKDEPCIAYASRSATSLPFSQSISNMRDYSVPGISFLDVYPEIIEWDNSSEMIDLIVFSNLTTWTVTSDQLWAMVINNDIANKLVRIAIGANSTGSSREARITLSGNDVPDRIVTIKQGEGTSINEIVENNAYRIFPNPAKDYLIVELDKKLTSTKRIEIFDQLGRLRIIEETNDSELYVINTQALEKGVYFIRVSGENVFYSRFFKL